MDIMILARRLDLPEQTLHALETVSLPPDSDYLCRLYMNEDFHAFSQATANLDELTILRMLLSWIPVMQQKYQALGIPEAIFRDNLKDFAIWCRHDIDRHGQPGFSHWRWVARSLRMSIIRLSRLQFEQTKLDADVSLGNDLLPAGTPLLGVHIPAGEPLDPAAVLDSFEQARNFFSRYFGKDYHWLHCETWLLSPQLQSLLPASSRIIQFQQLFRLYAQEDSRQAEERVFGFLADDPAVYPERTSLQKSLKDHLLSGGRITSGAGLRRL